MGQSHEERIRRLVAAELGVDAERLDDDQALNPVSLKTLVTALEDELGWHIEPDPMPTVGVLIEYAVNRLGDEA